MGDRAAEVIGALAATLASIAGGAPASVLQQLAAAGTAVDILVSVARGSESESLTDSDSSVPRSTDEALTAEAEPQCSNNELMDGLSTSATKSRASKIT